MGVDAVRCSSTVVDSSTVGFQINLQLLMKHGLKEGTGLGVSAQASRPLQVIYTYDDLERLEHKLFIGMLPKNISEAEVFNLVSMYGNIIYLKIFRGSQETRKAGCAFLMYETKEQALLAIESINGKHRMEGSSTPVVVKWAHTKKEREARRAQKAQSQASIATHSNLILQPSLSGALPMGYMSSFNRYVYQGSSVPLAVNWYDIEKERHARQAQNATSQAFNLTQPNAIQRPSLLGALPLGSMPPYRGCGYQEKNEAKELNLMDGGKVGCGSRAIDSSNVGFQLLKKLGWKEGMGLGVSEQGRLEPLQAYIKKNKHGLGAEKKTEKKKKKKRKKKMMNILKTKNQDAYEHLEPKEKLKLVAKKIKKAQADVERLKKYLNELSSGSSGQTMSKEDTDYCTHLLSHPLMSHRFEPIVMGV